MKFGALVFELHLPQNVCLIQLYRHFSKIVKICSGQPKTHESTNNRKLKFFTKTILLLNLYVTQKLKTT